MPLYADVYVQKKKQHKNFSYIKIYSYLLSTLLSYKLHESIKMIYTLEDRWHGIDENVFYSGFLYQILIEKLGVPVSAIINAARGIWGQAGCHDY